MESEAHIESPLGPVHVVCSEKGVTKIKFVQNYQKLDELTAKVTKQPCADNQHLKSAVEWLKTYFEDPGKLKNIEEPVLDLECHARKTFMIHVWQVLKERVGPGDTVSYGELAEMCSSPKAARAVGQAMKTNPFTLLVPCHRVLNAGRKVGNYSSGIDKKVWLLKHEGSSYAP